ncbi:hypothetical protein BDZ89DRAFT_1059322 [Hymenopellis radicata]|nr:hypothetical protein BDZ89DRAFT_1059322 [Hymenopellis radicata]
MSCSGHVGDVDDDTNHPDAAVCCCCLRTPHEPRITAPNASSDDDVTVYVELCTCLSSALTEENTNINPS